LHHPVPVPQELPQIPVLPTGYPDLGKITREQEVQNMQCILTIRLGLAASLGSDHPRISHPQLDMQSPQQLLEPARVSTGFHPDTHLFPLDGEVAIKLLRSLTMFQSLLSTISRFRIHKRNLLEARVIIASYNDHCPAPFYPSLFGWFSTTEVYSGIGAGVVMESISLAIQRRFRFRDQV
jgi:hypothetical protein